MTKANVVIAGTLDERTEMPDVKYGLIVEFASADDVREAMASGGCEFTVFEGLPEGKPMSSEGTGSHTDMPGRIYAKLTSSGHPWFESPGPDLTEYVRIDMFTIVCQSRDRKDRVNGEQVEQIEQLQAENKDLLFRFTGLKQDRDEAWKKLEEWRTKIAGQKALLEEVEGIIELIDWDKKSEAANAWRGKYRGVDQNGG